MNQLEIKKVNKKYPKFNLKDVSFDVPAGSIVGFIGRNGAGKTTTLKGIMNLVHFDSGSVFIFGKDIKNNELEIKQKIGFTLSELNYYPNKTIRQMNNVTKRFFKNYDESKYQQLCKMFELDENKKLQELSSGMKVKFSLATALSHDAELLILDEPTSGLDPISRDEILDIFESIIKNKKRSILFSTHITSDLDKCATHIAYIKEGEIQFFGEKKEFINSYRLIKGNKDVFDSVSDILISFKKHEKDFEGLIKANDVQSIKNNELSVVEPDLEQVMIYLERRTSNEEFDF